MNHYLEPDSHVKNKIKVEFDLSNQATKSDVEKAAGV